MYANSYVIVLFLILVIAAWANVQSFADGWINGKTGVIIQTGIVMMAFIADAVIT